MVEICFHNSEARMVMRVAGDVEFIDDAEIKTRILRDRPFPREVSGRVGEGGHC